MAQILKGAPVAAALSEQLIHRTESLKSAGIVPTLAILRVGERPDDISYETGAMKRCEKIGIQVKRFLLSADCRQEELLDTIRQINEDDTIHGCLMFRPLPNKSDEAEACTLLAPEKDVDCMTSGSLASVFTGKGAGYPPCTAEACVELLNHYGIPLRGKRVAVIGRSLVIGKPVSMMLQSRDATVTMCHSRTTKLADTTREADIVVLATGRAKAYGSEYFASHQTVIDVGINEDPGSGKMCGDVDFGAVATKVAAITPVPGGVGAVTTSVLMKHVVEAAKKAAERSKT